jgi:hypothetical protein
MRRPQQHPWGACGDGRTRHWTAPHSCELMQQHAAIWLTVGLSWAQIGLLWRDQRLAPGNPRSGAVQQRRRLLMRKCPGGVSPLRAPLLWQDRFQLPVPDGSWGWQALGGRMRCRWLRLRCWEALRNDRATL